MKDYRVYDNGGPLKLFTIPPGSDVTETPFRYGIQVPNGTIIAWCDNSTDAAGIVQSLKLAYKTLQFMNEAQPIRNMGNTEFHKAEGETDMDGILEQLKGLIEESSDEDEDEPVPATCVAGSECSICYPKPKRQHRSIYPGGMFGVPEGGPGGSDELGWHDERVGICGKNKQAIVSEFRDLPQGGNSAKG